MYYPALLDLRGRPALVVGGGPVAARKAGALAAAGARVTAVSPRFCAALKRRGVRRVRRAFRPSDLRGARVVVCATDDAALQQRVAALCERRAIPVNVVDVPERCSFIVPAHLRRGPLSFMVSTNGTGPALAAALRRELEELYPADWGRLAREIGRRRKAARRTATGRRARMAAGRALGSSRIVRTMRRRGLAAALRELP